ncbi:MAG: hypothetical protein VW450_06970 [Chloroflexota bacterium]
MAKLGPYSYPDIRFGDAVEIAGRVLTKFKGTVSVKGLAWELGMAEGSGTLFAKVAAMRDFGLIEGRGELRISPLARRVIYPANAEEGQEARAEAFQRVELLRQLYSRFEGEIPDDMSMLVGLEEITRAARDEIVRRAPLIQKHLTDAIRVLGRPVKAESNPEGSGKNKQNAEIFSQPVMLAPAGIVPIVPTGRTIELIAGERRLSVPLSAEYIDVAITLLRTLRSELAAPADTAEIDEEEDEDFVEVVEGASVAGLELGSVESLRIGDVSAG